MSELPPLSIRAERGNDIETLTRLTKTAFHGKSYSDGTEAECLLRLRADGDLLLSLVAERAGDILGHAAFSPAFVTGEQPIGWIGLGPISVWPDHQRHGIGSALVRAGLNQIKTAGHLGAVLVGDPNYYSRFGFQSDGHLHYRDVPDRYVQWLAFGEMRPSGTLTFSRGLE